MSPRLRSLKIPVLVFASLAGVYVLSGWLVLPRIIDLEVKEYVAQHTGHRLSFDRPSFNPLTLKLHVSNLRLDEADGKPLFALREFTLNLSLASVVRRALVFDAIRLDEPQATVVLKRDGRLNWSGFVDALMGAETPKPSETTRELSLPRFRIDSFVMRGGSIDFADSRKDFATRISPLDLDLRDISTLPNDRDHYKISAQVFGARLLWQGQSRLNPVGVTGSLAVENVDLARFAPYLKDVLPVRPPAGMVSLATDYRLTYVRGRLDLALENLQARLANVGLDGGEGAAPAVFVKAIVAKNGHFDLVRQRLTLGALVFSGNEVTLPRPAQAPAELLRLGALTLEYLHVDVAARNITVGHVTLNDGRLRAVRNGKGRIDIVDALRALVPGAPEVKARPAEPWHFRINQAALADFSATFHDETVTPPADLTLTDIAVRVDGISDNLSVPLPVRASFKAREGGRLDAVGRVTPAAPAADFHVKLADLALKPAQPYVTALASLTIAGGRLSTEGRASYGARGASYQGGFTVSQLRVVETGTSNLVVAWKSLGTRALEVTPDRVDIGRLDVDRLDTRLIISKDKSINISRVLRKPVSIEPASAPAAASSLGESAPAASAPAKRAAPEAAPVPEKKTPSFLLNIDRVRVRNSEMDFADLSLILPFETHIHKLHGFVNGISSIPGAPGQIELDGQVDDYGVARAVGQIELFNPIGYTDVKVMFGNVEMTRLTPYSTTFAGRRIDSGKLNLNLRYNIKNGQLAGDNEIIIDRLTLGERVKSPQALDLPLDLAIAILEDADRRIDLGLPVSGSINDPQFSYGSIVWKAIVNVFKMIATAPFRALANLFGGGVKIENVYFDPGTAELSPPERENVVRLAGALNKRPRLFVTVHGTWAEADRQALQDLQLRRAVAAEAGIQVAPGEDPGPLSTRSPKIQDALESLYSGRIGRGELAALKEGFRRANPGQLEEGFAGRMMSRLTSLFSRARTLEESEVEQLKGADFYAVLFAKLRAQEDVPELALQSLATARGDATYAALKAAQGPSARLTLGAPQKGESDAQGVAMSLDLGTAPAATVPIQAR